MELRARRLGRGGSPLARARALAVADYEGTHVARVATLLVQRGAGFAGSAQIDHGLAVILEAYAGPLEALE